MSGVAMRVRRFVRHYGVGLVAAAAAWGTGWALPRVSVAAWNQPVGSPLNFDQTKQAYLPSITSVAGVPYAAWQEVNDSFVYQLRVARLTVGGWSAVGTALNRDPAKHAWNPSITSVAGLPYVAWMEADSSDINQIRVAQLTGGGWSAVGTALNLDPTKNAWNPSITSVAGVPYVAWEEINGSIPQRVQIRVARWTGGAWSAVGGSLNIDPTMSAEHPSITSIGGVPYVAWTERDGSGVGQLRVAQLTGGGWSAVGGSLNADPTKDASYPRITGVGGVPYVAWYEPDGSGVTQIRVAQLTRDGWSAVGGSLNLDPTKFAYNPSIASIGGVPYVAWDEDNSDSTAFQVHVAQLTDGGWSAVGGSLNADPTHGAGPGGITSVGGVPYVVWAEDMGTGEEGVRVGRLDPDFLQTSAFTSDTGALLMTRVRDYGMSRMIAFRYGQGSGLTTQTVLQSTAGSGYDTVFAQVGGLTPSTSYSLQPFAGDPFRETAHGSIDPFTTKATSGPGPAGTNGVNGINGLRGPQGPKGEPGALILIAYHADVTRTRVTVRYVLTGTAKLELSVKPARGQSIIVTRANARMGIGRIVWNRKLRGKAAKRGTYKLTLVAIRANKRISSTLTIKLR